MKTIKKNPNPSSSRNPSSRNVLMKKSKKRVASMKKSSRKSVADEKQSLFSLLPVEIIWKILEYTGRDKFLAVTGDHVRSDTILLSQRQFKKYFDTRSSDYCSDRDYRLPRYFKQDYVVRLPLLADRLFQTYVKTRRVADDYVIAEDALLKTFLCNEDITNLPLLIDGKFCEYQKAMQAKEKNGTYDVTKDMLFLQYLGPGANADNIVECFNRLIDFDETLRAVNETDYTGWKLLIMRRLETLSLYKFFQQHQITIPECLMPISLAKVLITYTRMFEYSTGLCMTKVCSRCDEPSMSRESSQRMFESDCDWDDLYIALFCSKCANCLLKLFFELDDFVLDNSGSETESDDDNDNNDVPEHE